MNNFWDWFRKRKQNIPQKEEINNQQSSNQWDISLFEKPWFDRLVNRLEKEYNDMNESYNSFELKDMNDGRLCWYGEIEVNNQLIEVMVLYPYLYPQQPPIFIFDLDENKYGDIINQTGELSIFEMPNITWNTNTNVKTILDSVIDYIRIRNQSEKQHSRIEDKSSDEGEDIQSNEIKNETDGDNETI